MPAVQVPDLLGKLALIRRYGTMSWPDLGTAFGVRYKTVQYWVYGNARRAPGLLPEGKLAALTGLVVRLLPPDTPDQRVRQLLLGPKALLEAEICSGVSASLSAIIEAEGRQGQARLFRRDELGLVEYDDRPDESAQHRVKPGEWFRIAFPRASGCRYAVALQNAQYRWAVLRSSVPESGPVLVPAPSADGRPAFMCEEQDLGTHLFVCLQSTTPFSAALPSFAREHVTLDKRALDELAGAYKGLERKRRACFVLKVTVERDAAPGDAV